MGVIIYSLVAVGTTVLCEYATTSGNFITFSRTILSKITNEDQRRSYAQSSFVFHFQVSDKVVYLCLADKDYQKRLAFQFLDQLKQEFTAKYPYNAIMSAGAYKMKDFEGRLQLMMDTYSTQLGQVDKISHVKGQIDDTKAIMVENIDRLVQRGEQVELLVEQTNNLSMEAGEFRARTKKLKCAFCRQQAKLIAVISVIVGIIVLIVVLSIFA